eukprot:TRINITY_DN5391_c0_g1_i1.p1 TRINITY_DN5391_c0_g1~~TRINITY_DN5391_c0_g1_i1.p1  ORF type:complete len:344 (-),score=68.01 TRINITY_DN5391_c0_g1_i1:120-1151(-)
MELLEITKEELLEPWFDHLATVFENTPRSYFVRHYQNDTTRDFKAIQVLYDTQANTIASTLKVYLREVYVNGSKVKMGGIGEVSTKVQYRGKGLAKVLLQHALDFMKAQHIQISTLLTGKAAPLYASMGWVHNTRFLSKQSLSLREFDSFVSNFSIQNTDFSNEEQIGQLKEIHERFSIQFNGPVVRDIEYWKKWIQSESSLAGNFSFVMFDQNAPPHKLIAYLCVIWSPNFDGIKVKDFAVDLTHNMEDRREEVLRELISHSLKQTQPSKEILAQKESDVVSIVWPTPIARKIFPAVPVEIEKQEGFMYRFVDENPNSIVDLIQHGDNELTSRHLFWDIDKF